MVVSAITETARELSPLKAQVTPGAIPQFSRSAMAATARSRSRTAALSQTQWVSLEFLAALQVRLTLTALAPSGTPPNYIGDLAGDGTLAIQNGGSVSSSGISYIGTFSDSTGAVTVDGSGSTWTTSGALYVGGDIGVAGGSANLTVQGGGLVDVGTLAKVWGPGQVNLAAGTINAAQFELAGGTLTGFGIVNAEITGGSTITATGGVLTVGNAASTRGSVFLDVLLDGDYDDSGDGERF